MSRRNAYAALAVINLLKAASRGLRPLASHLLRRALLKAFARLVLRRVR